MIQTINGSATNICARIMLVYVSIIPRRLKIIYQGTRKVIAGIIRIISKTMDNFVIRYRAIAYEAGSPSKSASEVEINAIVKLLIIG